MEPIAEGDASIGETSDAGTGGGGSGQGNDAGCDSGTNPENDSGLPAEDPDAATSESEGEWLVLSDVEQTIDLIQLQNGISEQLGLGILEVCHYTQIRLFIKEASLVINSETFPMEVPSDALKLTHGFTLEEGLVTPLILDFDVKTSVFQTGSGTYKLQPTIKIVTGEPYPVTNNSETENNNTDEE